MDETDSPETLLLRYSVTQRKVVPASKLEPLGSILGWAS
jgi:hypothetical protein